MFPLEQIRQPVRNTGIRSSLPAQLARPAWLDLPARLEQLEQPEQRAETALLAPRAQEPQALQGLGLLAQRG
jgi:hypothetical protein